MRRAALVPVALIHQNSANFLIKKHSLSACDDAISEYNNEIIKKALANSNFVDASGNENFLPVSLTS